MSREIHKWMSINAIRRSMDLPPLAKGGDVYLHVVECAEEDLYKPEECSEDDGDWDLL